MSSLSHPCHGPCLRDPCVLLSCSGCAVLLSRPVTVPVFTVPVLCSLNPVPSCLPSFIPVTVPVFVIPVLCSLVQVVLFSFLVLSRYLSSRSLCFTLLTLPLLSSLSHPCHFLSSPSLCLAFLFRLCCSPTSMGTLGSPTSSPMVAARYVLIKLLIGLLIGTILEI